MTSLNLNTRVVRSEGFITSTIDNDLVMMSLDKGIYYGMDSIGSFIWERLDTPTTIQALCHDLMSQFDVEAKQCQEDVLAFLQLLLKEEMIHVVAEND